MYVFIVIILFIRYKKEFGFIIPSRSVIVDDIRVRAVAKGLSHSPKLLPIAGEDPTPVTVCVIIYCLLLSLLFISLKIVILLIKVL